MTSQIQMSAAAPYEEPLLDVDDIQGDPLLGFNKPYLTLIALDFKDDQQETIKNVKQFLTECVVPNITSAREVLEFRQVFRSLRKQNDGRKPKHIVHTCTNISFSYDALAMLTSEEDVSKFYDPRGNTVAYKVGLTSRSPLLNDPVTGIGASQNWVVGSRKNPHIFIQIASDRQSLINDEVRDLKVGLDKYNNCLSIEYEEAGKRRQDYPGREMFGFLDGVSNPGPRGKYHPVKEDTTKELFVTKRYIDSSDPRVNSEGRPGQNLIWPGEFILGLPKQKEKTTDPANALGPGSDKFDGPDWAKNGTFVVFRRLKQDVALFWNTMNEWSQEISEQSGNESFTYEHMAAKVISRWPSGAPILRTPEEDNPELGSNKLANNAYIYENNTQPYILKPNQNTDSFPSAMADVNGFVCPLSGHNRKVQPRDSSTDIGTNLDTLKHRIIRRGIQYGNPLPDDEIMNDDGQDRGLLFVAYQANIDKQFEFLIVHWANSDQNPNNGGGYDMVIGQSPNDDRERRFDVPLGGGKTVQLKTTNDFVIPTGGGYFFMPSISALTNVIAK